MFVALEEVAKSYNGFYGVVLISFLIRVFFTVLLAGVGGASVFLFRIGVIRLTSWICSSRLRVFFAGGLLFFHFFQDRSFHF